MHHSRCRALIGAIMASVMAAGTSVSAATLEYIGTYVWRDDDPRFGGFSGIEIINDGQDFYTVSDRSNLFWGSVERDPAGRIRHMNIAGRTHLKDSHGEELESGYLGDSEGIAIGEDGDIWISFEGLNRLVFYANVDAAAEPLPRPPPLKEIRTNRGFESVAIQGDGTLFTLPETAMGPESPVLRFRDGKWQQPFGIPYDPDWQFVGSDFGPDGWFYLLERGFHGVLGFSSRVRRFKLAEDGVIAEETLLESSPLQYDNLEGISVWEDAQGIRLTMISDDNFLFVQRTELVEYRLRN